MRNMMACTVTGQGAGTAAAVSIKVNLQENLFDSAANVSSSSTLTDSDVIYSGGGAHPGGGR